MLDQDVLTYDVELDGEPVTVPVRGYAFAAVQVVPQNYSSTTGVIEIKQGLSDVYSDSVSIHSNLRPNMTSKAIESGVDIRDSMFLFIDKATIDAGKFARVHIHVSEA